MVSGISSTTGMALSLGTDLACVMEVPATSTATASNFMNDRAQVLSRHMVGGAAVLAVSGVINDEYPFGRRRSGQQHQSFGIDRFAVPGGLGQEKLQPLHLGGPSLNQHRQRLGKRSRGSSSPDR